MLVLLHALISVLLHIYCTCFSTFWHCHPYILQYFNVFTPWVCCILAYKYNALCVCASPTHFAAGGHVKRT